MAASALLASGLLSGPLVAAADSALLKLRPVPFKDVKIQDSFWAPRREINRVTSIPFSLQKLEEAGNLEDLRLAGRGATNGFRGPVFMDSDLYKALEAASYSLATHPDPTLEKQLDDTISLLVAAQQPDGYLNSYFTVKEPGKRWTNLRDWHELYCAGHMFEAAVAHYQATGKNTFLNVATRYADYIDSVFGPAPKRLGYPGHPEIELALVKLWRATGNPHYFDLARFFVENRGQKFFATEHHTPLDKYDGSYWQDDVPICDHQNIKGHAVRAAYLMSGVTDVATQTGDERLLQMLDHVWRNTTERNEYITGGIGPSAHNEGFTVDYDLPNPTAYQETCATIALAQWAHRLALLYGDAGYADALERALYNGVLSGVSQDGTKFFYVNPLESAGTHHRSPWFGCACCPPNVTRTLAALGGYAYAASADSLYVNLYIQGSAQAKVGDTPVALKVTTEYPWDGKVTLALTPAARAKFALRLRIPGWCHNATVAVNHRAVKTPVAERNAVCLQCHEKNARTLWKGSAHEARNVACTDCHAVMHHESERGMLKKSSTAATCGSCCSKPSAKCRRRWCGLSACWKNLPTCAPSANHLSTAKRAVTFASKSWPACCRPCLRHSKGSPSCTTSGLVCCRPAQLPRIRWMRFAWASATPPDAIRFRLPQSRQPWRWAPA